MIEFDLSKIPSSLRSNFENRWTDFAQRITEQALVVNDGVEWQSLPLIWSASDFVAMNCLRYPAMLIDLIASGELDRDFDLNHYRTRLCASLTSVENDQQFMTELRQFRQREMVRIAWRDIGGKADVPTILKELSAFAIATIDFCAQRALISLKMEFGEPCDPTGKPMNLIVLGMGKLGADELNFSSDVDLIFSYRDEGETKGGSRSISNYEFFVKQSQRIVLWLNDITRDGFVFRVDTRLRPFGSAGQLALSFDAMEAYYETHGRDWERYALIKANVISGDEADGAALMKRLKPFIYRRYLDFNAFEALREMKRMISADVKRKGMVDNVKLGGGGIREVEFIGQAFQLIRGGQEKTLQDRRLLVILRNLSKLNLLPEYAVEKLISSYYFLRQVENRIQAIADQQTHLLPKSEIERARLTLAMGFPNWEAFKHKLDEVRQFVQTQFDQVFAAPQATAEIENDERDEFLAIWLGRTQGSDAITILSHAGFSNAEESYNVVHKLAESSACRHLSPRGRERIDRLMPMLIGAVAGHENPDTTLPRVLHMIESVAKRTVYLALLVEHPMALSQLVSLCAKSDWIADLLARYPLLLDELLDPRRLYEPMYKTQLAAELDNRLSVVEPGDTEGLMNIVRQFKLANSLRVAASQLTDAMPLAKVSDHLTFIAEVVLQKVIDITWQELVTRHGRPRYKLSGDCHNAGFAIIAYGKLAGWELGFGSDLDIVFLHDSQGEDQMTDGEKQVDNAVFFARLGQKIIHFLNTPTTNGVLYDVDTRLRPSGNSGLLVSSLDAFIEYQKKSAWTWEHQALVRSRAVAGDENVMDRFSQIRHEVLTAERDYSKLLNDVVEMRARMRKELDKSNENKFDLKQGAGGIIDVEFIIQYLVLRWARDFPDLTVWADNLRIIEIAAKTNRLNEEDAKLLTQAFLTYRHRVHERALDRAAIFVDADEYLELRSAVLRIWQRIFSTA